LLLDATNQMSQKRKLFRRQIKRHARADSFVPLQIKLQVVDAQAIFMFRRSAPQQRAHSGKQLWKTRTALPDNRPPRHRPLK
jgi:hypothetical protein